MDDEDDNVRWVDGSGIRLGNEWWSMAYFRFKEYSCALWRTNSLTACSSGWMPMLYWVYRELSSDMSRNRHRFAQ